MKPKLILLPGLGVDDWLWHHQKAVLQDMYDIEVMIFDQYESRQEMAEAVLQTAPPKFFLAGQSLGGWVAQEIAALAPERVKKLILINCWTRRNKAFNFLQKQAVKQIQAGNFEGVVKQYIPLWFHPQKFRDEEFLEAFKMAARRLSPEVWCRQMEAMIKDYETLPLLSMITAPTLVIHGREDQLFPIEEQEAITAHIPHAHLKIIDDCGHVSPLECPDETSALMKEWLSQ